MKKIAFCFLIYDVINHEEMWYIFFKNIDPAKYSIYIHYKTNKPLKYFEKYKLTNCIETRYENETIPLAYNVLFRKAYEDQDNYKFMILSGACIPLKSFDYIYNKLTADTYGYFNICPQSQCFPNCNYLLNVIDKKYIAKSHNWFILNRSLVNNLCFELYDLLTNSYPIFRDIVEKAKHNNDIKQLYDSVIEEGENDDKIIFLTSPSNLIKITYPIKLKLKHIYIKNIYLSF
jgi:hypothetical protein